MRSAGNALPEEAAVVMVLRQAAAEGILMAGVSVATAGWRRDEVVMAACRKEKAGSLRIKIDAKSSAVRVGIPNRCGSEKRS